MRAPSADIGHGDEPMRQGCAAIESGDDDPRRLGELVTEIRGLCDDERDAVQLRGLCNTIIEMIDANLRSAQHEHSP